MDTLISLLVFVGYFNKSTTPTALRYRARVLGSAPQPCAIIISIFSFSFSLDLPSECRDFARIQPISVFLQHDPNPPCPYTRCFPSCFHWKLWGTPLLRFSNHLPYRGQKMVDEGTQVVIETASNKLSLKMTVLASQRHLRVLSKSSLVLGR